MVQAEESKRELMTRFAIPASPEIGINSQMFFMGSCFSENIGYRFGQLGFNTFINPFGILYNPVSLANAAEKIATNYIYTEQELFYFNGNFHSLDHHGSFRHENASKLIHTLNEATSAANEFLKETNLAIITLGTSFVHILENGKKIVANCHKIPASEFEKRLLGEHEIKDALEKTCLFLRRFNPELRIIFTISPVKHLRDGVQENALSKARLLSALQAFLQDKNDTITTYFPAFEIMTEELRDHRFYAEDLAHPSPWSIQYIFRRFAECKLDERATAYLEPAIRYLRMKSHRIMSDNAAEIEKWNNTKADFLEKIKKDFPEKNWEHPIG